MLVLIYKQNGKNLLFPAARNESEMSRELFVSETNKLVSAGILKSESDKFLLTEPYASFVDGITGADILISASSSNSNETPQHFAYFGANGMVCIEAALTRPGKFRISSGGYNEWYENVCELFGVAPTDRTDTADGLFKPKEIFSEEYVAGSLKIADSISGDLLLTAEISDAFPYPTVRCTLADGRVSITNFDRDGMLGIISDCLKGRTSYDFG